MFHIYCWMCVCVCLCACVCVCICVISMCFLCAYAYEPNKLQFSLNFNPWLSFFLSFFLFLFLSFSLSLSLSLSLLLSLPPSFSFSFLSFLILLFFRCPFYGWNLVSPYIKNLGLVAANKLVHLFEIFSSPSFLFSAPSNHHLIFFLLEVCRLRPPSPCRLCPY